MKSWRPSRPSPAMIVALLSLCVGLGGSAIAATSSGGDPATSAAKKKKLAPKNSVNSAAVINNSLKLGDFKKSERAKLKGAPGAQGAQGIQGPAGTPDGYTKTEADGKFLGKGDKAADSSLLDGKDSSDYIQGEGSVLSAFRVFANNTNSNNFVSLPGIGHVEFSCGAAMSLTFANDSADEVQWEQSQVGTSGDFSSHTTAAGANFNNNLAANDVMITAQFHRFHSLGLGISNQDNVTLVMSVFRDAVGDAPSTCRVHAQVIHNHASSSFLVLLP
jgi:hypothetical protein